jgi:hypothetical protein
MVYNAEDTIGPESVFSGCRSDIELTAGDLRVRLD